MLALGTVLTQTEVGGPHKTFAVQLPGNHHTMHLVVRKLLNCLIIATSGNSERLQAEGEISPEELHCFNYLVI